MNPPPANPTERTLAESLRPVHVGLREDLEVSRHLFRGEVSYIVRDPMTFESQRLSLEDYQIFVGIDATRPLKEIFQGLLDAKRLHEEDEEKFYQFVLQLHRLGFLRLPVSDNKRLYERYKMRIRNRRREKLLGILFLRVPLWNPDAFLNRTIHLARPLFSRVAFAAWAMLMSLAIYVAWGRWDELSQPLQGVLLAKNLPLLWLTLIVLKTFHEFGHAYACKHYGGHVPEMGAYFILFTPCAYVDATASWGFPKKRERIFVCLAGMYVESIIAAIALFGWVMTEASLLNAVCYNVIFLASTVTVLFNINPLMRYDGYYVVSDALEIPNLRQRSSRYLTSVAKRLFLGVRSQMEAATWRLRAILVTFGTLATLYRVTILLAIAAVFASRFGRFGLMLGIGFVSFTLIRMVRRLMHYLWRGEETAAIRWRAVALGVIVLVLLPTIAVAVPFQRSVCVTGVVAGRQEAVIRTATSGFLDAVLVEPGAAIAKGESIAQLSDPARDEATLTAEARMTTTQVRLEAYRGNDPARLAQEQSRLPALEAALRLAREEQDRLTLRSPLGGTAVHALDKTAAGAFMEVGTPVARVVAGGWEVRAIIAEEQLAQARIGVGSEVEFRTAGLPDRTFSGVIKLATPAGSRLIDLPAATHAFGGEVPVDVQSGAAVQPYFELVIALDDSADGVLRHGMTGRVRLPGQEESLAQSTGRRISRFWNKMMRG